MRGTAVLMLWIVHLGEKELDNEESRVKIGVRSTHFTNLSNV